MLVLIIDKLSTICHHMGPVVGYTSLEHNFTKHQMNVTEKTLQKILNRKIKGYAFMSYPRDGFATAQEYREHHERELQRDNAQLSIIQFSCKYDVYMY